MLKRRDGSYIDPTRVGDFGVVAPSFGVRARVESNWRTRLLLLFAFVAAGVIAWNNVQTRTADQAARVHEETPRVDAVEAAADVVDVEIVAE